MRARLFAIAAALLLFGTATAFARPSSDATLRVGTLMAYTGALNEFGPAIHNGAAFAAKQLQEAGLSIEGITEDTSSDASVGATSARKLVDIDGMHAITGALSSGVTMPVSASVTVPA